MKDLTDLKTHVDPDDSKTYVERAEAADLLAENVAQMVTALRAIPNEMQFADPEKRARLTRMVEQSIAGIEQRAAQSIARLRYGSVS